MSLNTIKSKRPVTYRYSEAFKLHIIKEIESGHLSMSSAKRKYDIPGAVTIPGWLKRYGKNICLMILSIMHMNLIPIKTSTSQRTDYYHIIELSLY